MLYTAYDAVSFLEFLPAKFRDRKFRGSPQTSALNRGTQSVECRQWKFDQSVTCNIAETVLYSTGILGQKGVNLSKIATEDIFIVSYPQTSVP